MLKEWALDPDCLNPSSATVTNCNILGESLTADHLCDGVSNSAYSERLPWEVSEMYL